MFPKTCVFYYLSFNVPHLFEHNYILKRLIGYQTSYICVLTLSISLGLTIEEMQSMEAPNLPPRMFVAGEEPIGERVISYHKIKKHYKKT